VQVTEHADGSVAVAVSGANIVDASDAVALVVDTTGGVYDLRSERGTLLDITTGSVAEAMRVLNSDIPNMRAQLDVLARALVSGVNDLHATGTNSLDQTGILFFDDFGDVTQVTAANLTLSSAVETSANAIAAGSGVIDPLTGNPVFAAGNNDIALAIGQLRNDISNPALAGASMGGFYTGIVTELGLQVRSAADNATMNETLASQTDIRRSSVSGVSIDEEMVNLIRFQNAYAAATRVITAVDEMLQAVLDMKR
jgi:flagellar hook-associated protein 1 FlgK